jgi:radical SAM superfamily enzyme YgiQ (UPF0313 family)
MHFAVQFSRGCPFTCEFCDIIELYGRVPRVKTVQQILAELQMLYASGYRGHVDFVDDNFIGNKKAVKSLLPALIEWQRTHAYPFWFSTEASLNLADDSELLALMREANFGAVFVGIESPDATTLVATRKKQNTRRDIHDSVRRIHNAGMFVLAGFILGFDTEADVVAPQMISCIAEAAIPVCMAGLLVALPNTQLYYRLQREGRLYSTTWLADQLKAQGGDQCTLGLNFKTLRARRDILSDYRRVLGEIYSPKAYFARARVMIARMKCWPPHGEKSDRIHRWHLLGLSNLDWLNLLRLLSGALRAGPRTLIEVVRLLLWAIQTNRAMLSLAGNQAALYLHVGPFARATGIRIAHQIRAIDQGNWRPPDLEPAELGRPSSVSPQRHAVVQQ